MLKVSRYFRWTRALSTISRASLKLMKYVAYYLSKHRKLFENKSWILCQKESQATISEGSHVQWSFVQQKSHLRLQPCSLGNTLNRPFSAWESFDIREKLVLFVLGVTQNISNLTTAHSLHQTDASGWVGLALWC